MNDRITGNVEQDLKNSYKKLLADGVKLDGAIKSDYEKLITLILQRLPWAVGGFAGGIIVSILYRFFG